MAKRHYFFKLIPPRPRLMDEHGRYFQEEFAQGRILLFGPVMASGGAFGLGVLEVESDEDARGLGEGDPSVKAGLNKFEVHPMRVSAARAASS